MGERFTIRVNPTVGESLTSFMMRTAEINGTNYNSIMKYIGLRRESGAHLDDLPYRLVDCKKLSELLGIDEKTVISMTFSRIYSKFGVDIYHSPEQYKQAIADQFYKDNRRFCPECLKIYHGYKLHWQIKEIEICDIHKVRLISHCVNGHALRYCSDSLASCRCDKCGVTLTVNEYTEQLDNECIEKQNKIYRKWEYLLSHETKVFPVIPGYDYEVVKAISLSYVIERYSNEKNKRPAEILHSYYLYNVLFSMKGSKHARKISLKQTLAILNAVNIELIEFSQLIIPQEYIIKKLSSVEIELGPCFTPWCSKYGTNKSMKRIEGNLRYRTRYLPSICTECSMKYGYEFKGGNWICIDDKLRIIKDKCLPFITRGVMRSEIIKKTGCNHHQLDYAIAYAINHNLIDINLYPSFSSCEIESDIVSKFYEIIDYGGEMQKTSRALFGWNLPKYYLSLTTKEVQEFLLLNYQKKKVKINNLNMKEELNNKVLEAIAECKSSNQIISINRIGRIIGSTARTLYVHGFNELIKRNAEIQRCGLFINEKDSIMKKLTDAINNDEEIQSMTDCEKICKYLGIPYKTIWRAHKDIKNIILNLSIINKVKQAEEREKRYAHMIKEAIEELTKLDEKITHKNMIKYLGIGKGVLRGYPELRKLIEDSK